MTPKIKPKSNGILTSVKLWLLLPLPCEINVFTAQDPSRNEPKSLQKRTLQPNPPQNLQFSTSGHLWMATWAEKASKNGSFRGGRERPKNVIFAVRSCLGARMASKSPQASILEALPINFESFLIVYETFFIDVFHSCLHLMWVEGATENN